MTDFESTELHQALDAWVAPASVPPLPLDAIVRAGTRRRRARRTLGAAAVAAAVAAVAVVTATAWSGPGTVSPAAPVVSRSPRPIPSVAPADVPVRTAMPSGVVDGSRWTIHVVDYREKGDGMYCEDWKIVVDGHESSDLNGACSSAPVDQNGGAASLGVAIQRDPRDPSSALLGVMFEGDSAPAGAVSLRVTWAGGSLSAPVFLLRGNDHRRWFFLAVPYGPGHPDAWYDARLAFLDARGHVVPSEMLSMGDGQYSVKPFVKQ